MRLENPGVVVGSARSADLYGRLLAHLDTIIPDGYTDTTSLDKKQLAEAVQASVSSDHFYGFLESVLKAYLPYITGQSANLNFSYDLTDLKGKFGDQVVAKQLVAYSNLPTCQSKQLGTWSIANGLPDCRLSESTNNTSDIERSLVGQKDGYLKDLPDHINISQPGSGVEHARSIVTPVQQKAQLMLIASLVLVGVFMLLFRRGSLLSLAIICLIVGLIEIGFSLVGWGILEKAANELVVSKTSQALVPALSAVSQTLLDILKTTLGNISIGFLVAGALFLLLAILFRSPKKPAEKLTPAT